MKYCLLCVLVLLAACGPGDCRESDTTRKSNKVMALAQTQHNCAEVQILRYGHNWRLLDVCGVQRFYEYGGWCPDCTWSWRERPTKTGDAR